MCVHKHEVLQNTVTTKKQTFQQRRIRAAAMAKCAELLSVALTPHMGASLCSAEPLLTQLPACGFGKLEKLVEVLGSLHPCGSPRRSSWLLVSSS